MKGEGRIIELLIEMIQKQELMVKQQDQMISRMDRHEEQFKQINVELADLRLRVLPLAAQLMVVADHKCRLDPLERAVFKN